MNTISQSTPAEWYAVYTYPNVEKKVHETITEMGVETYLPLQKTVKQWSDRQKKVEVPLFPNYVFVKTTPQKRFDLFHIKGLVRFVAFEGKPVSIPEQEIDTIKRVLGKEGVSLNHAPVAGNQGEYVKIMQGQFAGTEGVIVREASGKNRLIVQIRALKQTLSIDIPAEHLTACHQA